MRAITKTTIKFNERLLSRGYMCAYLGTPKKPNHYTSVDVYVIRTSEYVGNFSTTRSAYNFIFRTKC